MFRNYVVVTLRNLVKSPTYSFINIAGLAIGIACSILILLWVFDELSFDRFIPKSDRLYQVYVNGHFDGKVSSWRSVPLPTYEALKPEHARIAGTCVMNWGGAYLFDVNDPGSGKGGIRKNAYYASEEFLTMFEFPVIKGDARQALVDPYSVVISESMAKALFGDEEPMGKTIRFEDRADLRVTAVIRDVPSNSSFTFDALVPWNFYEMEEWVKNNMDNWGNYSFQVFLELADPRAKDEVEMKIKDLLTRHGETDYLKELFLHPLQDWRLYSNFENGRSSGGMIEYVKMFTVIAIFILVIACINFMNLSTARSERRAREVGIRKSVGSRRMELIGQFLGESIFISLIAFSIAVLMAQLLLPFYNDLVEKELHIDYQSLRFWLFAVGLILFTGIVSGSYPAFYLSSFEPVKVLKGKVRVGRGAGTPRKVLVTLQFGFSILLIIGTMVIYEQIRLVKNRDLGYSQENLIAVEMTREIQKNYRAMKQELLNSGVVEAVTQSNSAITQINSNNFLGWPGKPDDLRVLFATVATEYDYARTMGIRILDGRDFSEDFKSDTAAVIINKAAADLMNLQDPIGTRLDLWGQKRELIGIVDNVLMGSPYTPVGPMFIILDPDWVSYFSVRLSKTDDLQAALGKVEDIVRKYNPAYPFEYEFADVAFARKFRTIDMTSSLANLFASLAIFITGLGLFGLAAFTAEQRTKEIGIRKVLGAPVVTLVTLISKDFSKLVVLAFIISAPLSWWLLDSYLQRYTYRIDIPWWVFPLTGLVALVFALLIVSSQALRAAHADPVRSLRTE